MSIHNNLRPRHVPTWLGTTLAIGLGTAAAIVQLKVRFVAGWFSVCQYIALLFATIILSFRPAWGRRIFWWGLGILLGLHTLAGLLLVFSFSAWLHVLGSFRSVIFLADLLMTMAVLWRITIAHGRSRSNNLRA